MRKRIALVDVDGHNGFPNIPLMKLASYFKSQGDEVEWHDPIFGGHYYKGKTKLEAVFNAVIDIYERKQR